MFCSFLNPAFYQLFQVFSLLLYYNWTNNSTVNFIIFNFISKVQFLVYFIVHYQSNYIEHINCFRYTGSISLIYILNYTLNQNLTFLILVQYMFNLSFDVFEIPFIYADFSSFRRFCLFNFKFKSTCFRRRSDSHWTILSEKLFLCNQIYRLFHAFSFLIIPLSRQIIYYVIWNIS